MADQNTSLPIRTETNGDVVSKICDSTVTSQHLTVNADGSINITDNSGSITVDATNLDIRDLVFATDKVDVGGSIVALDAPTLAALESITVQNGAGAAAVNIQDGGNSITVDATDLDIRDLAFATDKVDVSGSSVTDGGGSLTVDATNFDIRDLVFATDKVDVGGSIIALDAPTLAALESITVQNGAGASAVNIQDGGNSITVDAVDLDIRDLTAASDSVKSQIADGTGTYYSASNPVPVSITSNNIGDEINDYNTAAAIAAAATSNHDYTVTALKTLLLSQIEASASGKCKIEVKIETGVGAGTFTSKFVQFNSTATPNMHIELKAPISVAAGVKVRITRTNLDNQAQDLYSTISGQEI